MRVTSSSCPSQGMGEAICTPCTDQLVIDCGGPQKEAILHERNHEWLSADPLCRYWGTKFFSSTGSPGWHSGVSSIQGAISASSGPQQAGGHTHADEFPQFKLRISHRGVYYICVSLTSVYIDQTKSESANNTRIFYSFPGG